MKRICKTVLALLFLLWVFSFWPRIPEGTGVVSEVHMVKEDNITFLVDETYVNEQGERASAQEIFDEAIRMIKEADSFVLVDMFLWNDFQGKVPETHRAIATELRDVLIQKKQVNPKTRITVITDPVNTVYGGVASDLFLSMKEAGITVVFTDLYELRDSNTLYSMWYRPFGAPFGNSTGGWLPNPLDADGEEVTMRTYLRLFNFKANHRKVLVTDKRLPNGRSTLVTLITSANPHDGSSAHSNVALRIEGSFGLEVITSEEAVANMSGASIENFDPIVEPDSNGEVAVQLLTENGIEQVLVEHIDATEAGDSLDMLMFYLSDRDVVRALKRAHDRGVVMRIVLDPNKDAFGREKNGVPNRPVAHELANYFGDTNTVRWCDTHGEQCHSKMVLIRTKDEAQLFVGSANITRRNIGGYNLESNVVVSGAKGGKVFIDAQDLFDRVWNNKLGRTYTVSYDAYKDDTVLHTLMYRIMEFTGMSSF